MVRKASLAGAVELRRAGCHPAGVSGDAIHAEGLVSAKVCLQDGKKTCGLERGQWVGSVKKRDKGQEVSCQLRQGVWILREEQQEALGMFQVDE